jgi:hypothetical protein
MGSVLHIKYEEYITKLYDFSKRDLTLYTNKFNDIDLEYVINDMNKEDTRFYFINLSIKMLSKIDTDIKEEIYGYVYATFDAVFKYMFDIDFNFNFNKLCENFEKFQFELLTLNNWNFRNQV